MRTSSVARLARLMFVIHTLTTGSTSLEQHLALAAYCPATPDRGPGQKTGGCGASPCDVTETRQTVTDLTDSPEGYALAAGIDTNNS